MGNVICTRVLRFCSLVLSSRIILSTSRPFRTSIGCIMPFLSANHTCAQNANGDEGIHFFMFCTRNRNRVENAYEKIRMSVSELTIHRAAVIINDDIPLKHETDKGKTF